MMAIRNGIASSPRSRIFRYLNVTLIALDANFIVSARPKKHEPLTNLSNIRWRSTGRKTADYDGEIAIQRPGDNRISVTIS